jgi:hypothetical protein
METDIGNPIDYNPNIDPLMQEKVDEPQPQEEQPYYFQQPEMNYPPQPEKTDFFSSVDKSTWIVAFAVFLLGFFMGKTMQPVILRYN